MRQTLGLFLFLADLFGLPLLVLFAGLAAFWQGNILSVLLFLFGALGQWGLLLWYILDYRHAEDPTDLQAICLALFFTGELVLLRDGAMILWSGVASGLVWILAEIAKLLGGSWLGFQEKFPSFFNFPNMIALTLMFLGLAWFLRQPNGGQNRNGPPGGKN